MIEVRRAALTAGRIAHVAEFFSVGTNDLTQMGWGLSRDDVEGAFPRNLALGIFDRSPSESIDIEGIGRLIQIAAPTAVPPMTTFRSVSAANTAPIPTRRTSSTSADSTTSPARRSACR